MTSTEDLETTGTPRGAEGEGRLITRLGWHMHQKLAANRHKRSWRDPEVTDAYLLRRLHEEVAELEMAIDHGEDRWPEAADVANLAAMLADRG